MGRSYGVLLNFSRRGDYTWPENVSILSGHGRRSDELNDLGQER